MRNTSLLPTNHHLPSTISAWVKNVYSLCVEGVVNSVKSSPTTIHRLLTTSSARVQPQLLTNTLTSFTPTPYTANFYQLPDTNYHLSTLSTAPTIKKNKKK